LRAAAALINGGITSTAIKVDQPVVDAVNAADPQPAARAIPAGLPDPLLRAVLVVYSDLSSRRAAFNRAGHLQVLWSTSDEGRQFLLCLSKGAQAAAHFAEDRDAAERLAAATPAIAVAPPGSHAAGNVAVLQEWIALANNGCASCGGSRLTEPLPPIVWERHTDSSTPGTSVADGRVGPINFNATYEPMAGWNVQLWAC
jgi:hypothetical protein